MNIEPNYTIQNQLSTTPVNRKPNTKTMQTSRRFNRKRAFSLVDTMVAFFVIVVGVLGCSSLLILSRKLSTQSQIQAAAYQACSQELEELKAFKCGNRLNTTSGTFTVPSAITTLYPNQNLSGYYTIAPYGSYSTPPVQQIVVKISWTRKDTAGSISSSVQLDTLVATEPGK